MVSTTDLAKLTAEDDILDDLGDLIIILNELQLNLIEQGLVAKEYAATECIAQELAGKLPYEVIAAMIQ